MAMTPGEVAQSILTQMLTVMDDEDGFVFDSITEAVEAGYLELDTESVLYWLTEAATEAQKG